MKAKVKKTPDGYEIDFDDQAIAIIEEALLRMTEIETELEIDAYDKKDDDAKESHRKKVDAFLMVSMLIKAGKKASDSEHKAKTSLEQAMKDARMLKWMWSDNEEIVEMADELIKKCVSVLRLLEPVPKSVPTCTE